MMLPLHTQAEGASRLNKRRHLRLTEQVKSATHSIFIDWNRFTSSTALYKLLL